MSESPTTPLTEVTINTKGAFVCVKSRVESLAEVSKIAQELHREAHQRCAGELPSGFGGAL